MRVNYDSHVWEWRPDEQLLVVDYPCSGEVKTYAYQGKLAPQRLRENSQRLINVAIELEKMAVLIERDRE